MQQTENYKLNLIETTDVFSPAPLNENAQTLETALTTETAARTAGDAALEGRITALEAEALVFGTYKGNGKTYIATQDIILGFTPRLVCVVEATQIYTPYIAMGNSAPSHGSRAPYFLKIIENGFSVGDYTNENAKTYYYIAIV